MPVYLDFKPCTPPTAAPGFRDGLKLAQPKLRVIVIMGDGMFWPSAATTSSTRPQEHRPDRRGGNNSIYGMTGASTARRRRWKAGRRPPVWEHRAALPIRELAAAAGPVVARSTVYYAVELDRFIEQPSQRPGSAW
jgi:pyruvate/2-oxoacid:ferredoxin oxidoreductase beta subunit